MVTNFLSGMILIPLNIPFSILFWISFMHGSSEGWLVIYNNNLHNIPAIRVPNMTNTTTPLLTTSSQVLSASVLPTEPEPGTIWS